jgi:hypothetical protein
MSQSERTIDPSPDPIEMLRQIGGSLHVIEVGQQGISESLRDARGRLQILEAVFMRSLERLERIEASMKRILVAMGAGPARASNGAEKSDAPLPVAMIPDNPNAA